MIIFDIRLGRFSILTQREPDWRRLNMAGDGQGEITIDLPYVRVFLTNYRRTASRSQ